MPDRSLRSLFLFSVLFLFFSATLTSQVVVERSKDKVIISGKPYYIHVVKKGETSYSISKAYFITVDDLVRENPQAERGIREGQSLRIPVTEAPPKQTVQKQPAKDESKYIYHKLTTGDTVYSLARKFGVSEEEILKSNPGVEINKLAIGTEIAIPRKEFTTTTQKLETPASEKEYITHRVEKGESVVSIAEKYGITVRELRRENRGLIFPRVDDFVKIPVTRINDSVPTVLPSADTALVSKDENEAPDERPEGYTPVVNLRGKCNVAVLLPMYFEENQKRTEIDSSQSIKGKKIYKVKTMPDSWIYKNSIPFLEMYQGILLAADTLRALGMDIDIHLFDIKRDSSELKRLIDSGRLSDMDLMIGPVYSNNLSIVSKYADDKDIPVVSPVPLLSNSVLINNRMTFMANPSLEVAQEKISAELRDDSSANFVFIHSDSLRSDPSVAAFKRMIFTELSTKTPLEEIRFKELLFISRSMLSNDSINRLEHSLSLNSLNVILIASEDPAVISETLMDVHTLSKKYNIKVIGYPAMRDLKNLDPKLYFDLGIELYSSYWIDYSRPDVRRFILSYRKKFLTEPPEESYAWQGYDIAYYFISGLAVHGKRFIRKPQIHNPDLLETEFDFIREDSDSGFENHKLFLIKFTGDMEIKVVEDYKNGPGL
jgi:LysM repeat protein